MEAIFTGAPRDAARQPTLIPMRGYLIKDPVRETGTMKGLNPFAQPRRRFFECTDKAVEWYVDEHHIAGLPRGRMALAGATIELRAGCRGGGNELVVEVKGQTLVLRGEDLDAWAAALRQRV